MLYNPRSAKVAPNHLANDKYNQPTINLGLDARLGHLFLFITAYAVLYNRPAVLIISSIACWLNLEAVLRYAKFGSYGTLIFMPQFIAALFGLTIVLLFVDLFRKEPHEEQIVIPENTAFRRV